MHLHLGAVDLDVLGDVVRQRLDRELARDVLEDAALDDARGVLLADQADGDRGLDRDVEVDPQEVDVHQLVAHGMALGVLEDRGGGRGAADAQLEHRALGRQRLAQGALADRERDRSLTPAVEDAGDLAGTAQAAGLTGVGGLAGREGRLGGSLAWAAMDGRAGCAAARGSPHPPGSAAANCLVALKIRWMSVNAGFLTPVIVIMPFWWIGDWATGCRPPSSGARANSSSVHHIAPDSHGLVA